MLKKAIKGFLWLYKWDWINKMEKRCDDCGERYKTRQEGMTALRSRFCSDRCRLRFFKEKRKETHISKQNKEIEEEYY